MGVTKKELTEMVQMVVDATIKKLETDGYFSVNKNQPKSAYQCTEQLLYRYRNLQDIVADRREQIEDIKQYGVPQRGGAVVSYSGDSTVREHKLEEEKRQDAIYAIEKSMELVVRVLGDIDKAMESLKSDPWHRVVEMIYFEGCSQEDVVAEFKCSQPNVSYHKKRLVNKIACKLFPDKVVGECLA